jgi:cell division inhibitor SulA/protein ImuA
MFDPLQIPNVWRAQSLTALSSTLPTGFDSLNTALGGGWPSPALLEILTDAYGIGEVQLVLPLLRALTERSPKPALIVWLNPPYEPNAVALAQQGFGECRHWLAMNLSSQDVLWSMEQALKAGACAAVLAWASQADTPSLRRLKLAVSGTQSHGILYRPAAAATQPSPSHIRLQLGVRSTQLLVKVLKVPGRNPCELTLDVDAHRLNPTVTPR